MAAARPIRRNILCTLWAAAGLIVVYQGTMQYVGGAGPAAGSHASGLRRGAVSRTAATPGQASESSAHSEAKAATSSSFGGLGMAGALMVAACVGGLASAAPALATEEPPTMEAIQAMKTSGRYGNANTPVELVTPLPFEVAHAMVPVPFVAGMLAVQLIPRSPDA